MRPLVLLLLAACTDFAAREEARGSIAAPEVTVPVVKSRDLPATRRVALVEPAPVPRPKIIAGPMRSEVTVDSTPRIASAASGITLLAITTDGTSAVTTDALGSARLWPTLDGKREPFVLAMRAPSALALVRDDDMLAVAGVDAAGQLEIVRASTQNNVTERMEVATERPIVEVHATRTGFVALRDDRAVVLLDAHGEIRASLQPERGEYLAAIAVHDERAIALVEREDRAFGRWIDTAAATWGEPTRRLPVSGDVVKLSPDHERIAVKRRDKNVTAVVALARGTIVDTIDMLSTRTRLMGFVDANTVALMDEGASWWGRGEDLVTLEVSVHAVASSGLLVGAQGNLIALTTRESAGPVTEYLGYRLPTIGQLRATRDGFIAAADAEMVELDRGFRTRAGFTLEGLAVGLGALALVGDRHALAFSNHANRSLYLISTDLATTTLVASDVVHYAYEPSTRLLYYSVPNGTFVSRFDKDAFGPAFEIDQPQATQVVLLPGDANREIALMLLDDTATEYRATFARLGADGLVTTGKRTFTPSQHWFDTNGDPRTLLPPQRMRVRSPDRSMTAEIVGQRLTLHTGKTERWTVPADGAHAIVWTPDNELVVFGAGVARIDLETGALRDRRCGAWFGRWSVRPETFADSRLCEVP